MEDKKKICCIHRLGNHEKHELVSLEDSRKVTLGRLNTNDLCLNEAQCISRQHAVLEKNENDLWTITDLKSGNGVLINGEYITPSVQRILKDKDVIEFGKDPNTSDPAVYRFQFYQAVKIKVREKREGSDDEEAHASNFKAPPLKRLRLDNKAGPSPSSQVRRRLAEQERLLREEMQRKEKEAEERFKAMERILAEKEAAQQKVMQEMIEYRQKMETEFQEQKKQKELLEEKRKEDISKVEEMKVTIQSKVEEMNVQLQEKEQKQEEMAIMVEEMKQEKDYMEKQMDQQKEELEKEKAELAIEMQQKLEMELKEQENKLKQQLHDEIALLELEKTKVEQSLQIEMKKAIEQKDKLLEEELKNKQEELARTLHEKEEEQRTLLAEIEKHKESGEKEKNKLVEGIEYLMEEELVCTICSELFIQAMSLGCSHSFCSYCIKEWMLRKMQCPNCRSPITSCVRSIVLDNYIDKMSGHFLSEEMKERRTALVTERKAAEEAQKKKEEEKKKKAEQQRRATAMAAVAQAQPARIHNVLDTIMMTSPVRTAAANQAAANQGATGGARPRQQRTNQAPNANGARSRQQPANPNATAQANHNPQYNHHYGRQGQGQYGGSGRNVFAVVSGPPGSFDHRVQAAYNNRGQRPFMQQHQPWRT